MAGTADQAITVGTISLEGLQAGDVHVNCGVNKACTAPLANAGNTCSVHSDCDITPGDGTCTATTWEELSSGTPDASGEYTDSLFDTSGYGGKTLGFRSHFKAGSTGFANGQKSACVPLTVNEAEVECEGDVEIAASFAEGDGTPTPDNNKASKDGPWTVRISVKACVDLTGVTAQGGDNGWAPSTKSGLHPDTGTADYRKQNRRSSVILWEIGDMIAGDEANLTIDLDGPIPPNAPDCQLRYLSGPWSATYSTDGGATFQKEGYTERITISVDQDADGNPSCP